MFIQLLALFHAFSSLQSIFICFAFLLLAGVRLFKYLTGLTYGPFDVSDVFYSKLTNKIMLAAVIISIVLQIRAMFILQAWLLLPILIAVGLTFFFLGHYSVVTHTSEDLSIFLQALLFTLFFESNLFMIVVALAPHAYVIQLEAWSSQAIPLLFINSWFFVCFVPLLLEISYHYLDLSTFYTWCSKVFKALLRSIKQQDVLIPSLILPLSYCLPILICVKGLLYQAHLLLFALVFLGAVMAHLCVFTLSKQPLNIMGSNTLWLRYRRYPFVLRWLLYILQVPKMLFRILDITLLSAVLVEAEQSGAMLTKRNMVILYGVILISILAAYPLLVSYFNISVPHLSMIALLRAVGCVSFCMQLSLLSRKIFDPDMRYIGITHMLIRLCLQALALPLAIPLQILSYRKIMGGSRSHRFLISLFIVCLLAATILWLDIPIMLPFGQWLSPVACVFLGILASMSLLQLVSVLRVWWKSSMVNHGQQLVCYWRLFATDLCCLYESRWHDYIANNIMFAQPPAGPNPDEAIYAYASDVRQKQRNSARNNSFDSLVLQIQLFARQQTHIDMRRLYGVLFAFWLDLVNRSSGNEFVEYKLEHLSSLTYDPKYFGQASCVLNLKAQKTATLNTEQKNRILGFYHEAGGDQWLHDEEPSQLPTMASFNDFMHVAEQGNFSESTLLGSLRVMVLMSITSEEHFAYESSYCNKFFSIKALLLDAAKPPSSNEDPHVYRSGLSQDIEQKALLKHPKLDKRFNYLIIMTLYMALNPDIERLKEPYAAFSPQVNHQIAKDVLILLVDVCRFDLNLRHGAKTFCQNGRLFRLQHALQTHFDLISFSFSKQRKTSQSIAIDFSKNKLLVSAYRDYFDKMHIGQDALPIYKSETFRTEATRLAKRIRQSGGEITCLEATDWLSSTASNLIALNDLNTWLPLLDWHSEFRMESLSRVQDKRLGNLAKCLGPREISSWPQLTHDNIDEPQTDLVEADRKRWQLEFNSAPHRASFKALLFGVFAFAVLNDYVVKSEMNPNSFDHLWRQLSDLLKGENPQPSQMCDPLVSKLHALFKQLSSSGVAGLAGDPFSMWAVLGRRINATFNLKINYYNESFDDIFGWHRLWCVFIEADGLPLPIAAPSIAKHPLDYAALRKWMGAYLKQSQVPYETPAVKSAENTTASRFLESNKLGQFILAPGQFTQLLKAFAEKIALIVKGILSEQCKTYSADQETDRGVACQDGLDPVFEGSVQVPDKSSFQAQTEPLNLQPAQWHGLYKKIHLLLVQLGQQSQMFEFNVRQPARSTDISSQPMFPMEGWDLPSIYIAVQKLSWPNFWQHQQEFGVILPQTDQTPCSVADVGQFDADYSNQSQRLGCKKRC